MKIKKVLDKNLVIEWYDFETEKNIGGIIVAEYMVREVRENRGIIKMIGNNVEHVKVGDYIMYAVGTLYLPFETDDGKIIIIPEDDVMLILEEENG